MNRTALVALYAAALSGKAEATKARDAFAKATFSLPAKDVVSIIDEVVSAIFEEVTFAN